MQRCYLALFKFKVGEYYINKAGQIIKIAEVSWFSDRIKYVYVDYPNICGVSRHNQLANKGLKRLDGRAIEVLYGNNTTA